MKTMATFIICLLFSVSCFALFGEKKSGKYCLPQSEYDSEELDTQQMTVEELQKSMLTAMATNNTDTVKKIFKQQTLKGPDKYNHCKPGDFIFASSEIAIQLCDFDKTPVAAAAMGVCQIIDPEGRRKKR